MYQRKRLFKWKTERKKEWVRKRQKREGGRNIEGNEVGGERNEGERKGKVRGEREGERYQREREKDIKEKERERALNREVRFNEWNLSWVLCFTAAPDSGKILAVAALRQKLHSNCGTQISSLL